MPAHCLPAYIAYFTLLSLAETVPFLDHGRGKLVIVIWQSQLNWNGSFSRILLQNKDHFAWFESNQPVMASSPLVFSKETLIRRATHDHFTESVWGVCKLRFKRCRNEVCEVITRKTKMERKEDCNPLRHKKKENLIALWDKCATHATLMLHNKNHSKTPRELNQLVPWFFLCSNLSGIPTVASATRFIAVTRLSFHLSISLWAQVHSCVHSRRHE